MRGLAWCIKKPCHPNCPYFTQDDKTQAYCLFHRILPDTLALLKEQEWHPVTDPPKQTEVCLLTCNQWGGEIIRKGYYLSDEKIFTEKGRDITEYVTHWMPAPKPPKEAENGD